MRTIGLDVGDKKTGVAISDPEGIFATPLTVLTSEAEDSLIDQILKIVKEHQADCIVIGLPRRLDGEIGAQATKVTAFAHELSLQAQQRNLNQLEIRLWDERLSTWAARRLQTEAGGKGTRLRSRPKRKTRHHRLRDTSTTHSIAAALILQGYLDSLIAGRERRDE